MALALRPRIILLDELLAGLTPTEGARATVAAHFTWKRCGEQTLAAYEHALE